MSNYQKPHDHEEEDDKQHDGHGHATATQFDALLGPFRESFASFTAP